MTCFTPYLVQDSNKRIVPVPCGRCERCTTRKISEWSFRLMNEDRYSTSSHFITFTYDRKHVHITPNGFMGLNPLHLTNYFKRLRITQERHYAATNRLLNGRAFVQCKPIKYYAVGEYGGKSGRPHFHALIFNADINLISKAWVCTSSECGCGQLMGDLHYGQVSGASVGYTLKYMFKTWKPKHANDDRHPQFSRMSKHLGERYITPSTKSWHRSDLEQNCHLTLRDGRKISMPRYYKDKIYNSEERGHLKGYFEKEAIKEDFKHFLADEGVHSPRYPEGVKASFQRIYHQSILNETL